MRFSGLLPLVLGASLLRAAAPAPNVVVIVADDVSPAYLSAYGGRTPTPHLDRLAASGARFDRAYSVAALCNPSRYTLFTGRFPGRNPALIASTPPGAPYTVVQNTRLTEGDRTLARLLGAAGYLTGHVGKWHSNFEYGPVPDFPQGGSVEDPAVDAALKARTEAQAAAVRRITGFDVVDAFVSGNLDARGVNLPDASRHNPEWQTAAAVRFIRRARGEGRPFYLHLANTIPHSPDNLEAVDANPRFSRGGILAPLPADHPARATVRQRLAGAGLGQKGIVASINAGMIMLDDQVGAILRTLEETGALENTLIVFLGDHSVVGKGSPYAEGNRVPLLIRAPGAARTPTVVPSPVSLVDVVPTVLEAAGLLRDGAGLDGRSLLPAVQGRSDGLADRAVYLEMGVTRSVIQGDWQYIAFRPSPVSLERLRATPGMLIDLFDTVSQPFQRINLPHKPHYFEPDQLYDLSTDPFCRRNLAGEPAQGDRLARLRSTLGEITGSFERPFPLETPPEMTTEAYLRSAKEAHDTMAARPRSPERDQERIFNLNLPDPSETP